MADISKILKIILRAEDNASEVIDKFQKKAEKLSANMQKVGTAMIGIGAAPTAALLGATKAAIDFESSFAGVRKTVDASEEEFAQIADNFRNISKTTPAAINDLNRIGELAGQLGIRGVDNLTKFTKTIADIAVTTNLTEEEAATSFARIANIMQEPIENIDRMASTVVDLGNNFATTEAEIVAFSERISGAGKIAGLTTADVMAIGTAMSSVGVEAEAGGTAVQKVLISMYQAASGSTSAVIDNSKAIGTNTDKLADMKKSLEIAQMQQKEFGDKTKDSTKALKQAQIDKYAREIGQLEGELGALNATHGQAAISAGGFAKVLGVTNKEFEKMFKNDPSAVFEQFVTKLGEISKEGGDAAGILEDLDLADQRLIRSFLSLSNAGDLLTNSLNTSQSAWEENSALTTEAEKRYATTAAQIQIFKNNMADLGITLGEVILPKINELLTALIPLVEKFAAWAEEHPGMLTGLLAIGAAIGVIGTALTAVSFILPGLTMLFTGLGAVIGSVTSVIGGIVAILGGPVTIAIGIVIGLVALLAAAWRNNWFDIQGKTKAVVDFILKKIDELHQFFKNVFITFMEKDFKGKLLTVLDVLSGGWITRFNNMKDAVQGLINKMGDLINKAKDLGSQAAKGLKIPGFQHGGFVPGDSNDAVPAILHGGERVIPRNGTDVNPGMGGGSGGVTINISGSFNLDSEYRVNELADRIIRILGRQNELAGKGVSI